nr:hypothetical protein [Georgfuchsia toluolica]
MRCQPVRDGPRLIGQCAIGERLGMFVLLQQADVQAIRMARDMPFEYVGQRPGFARLPGFIDARRQLARLRQVERHARGCGGQRAQQIARRARIGDERFGQAYFEGTLDAQDQLHARQAVDAQFVFQVVVERYARHELATQLGQHLADDAGQARLGRFRTGGLNSVHVKHNLAGGVGSSINCPFFPIRT